MGELTEWKRSAHHMHGWLGQDVSLYRQATTICSSPLASSILWQITFKLLDQTLDMWLLQHAQVLAGSNVERNGR